MTRRWALALVALAACADRPLRADAPAPAPWSDAWLLLEGEKFLGDTASRRAALEASLTNPANAYSRLRLASYAQGAHGWDLLPEWNPRSAPLDAPPAPLWDGRTPATMPEWIALGQKVFFGYPMRADYFVEYGLAHPALAAATGLPRDGFVAFDDVDGQRRVGITCATCHSAVRDGTVVAGAARRTIDLGRLRVAVFDDTGTPLDPDQRRRMSGWGPGRADVTEDDDEDPVAIPDLWGLRTQRWLTAAGTIRHQSPLALAIRQETQLTDSNHVLVRPPRTLVWALTLYLYSLAPPAVAEAAPARGRDLFVRECRGCHANAAFGGRAIAAEEIGTDPALARGRGRGTGHYRTPPLLDVRHGAPYLHDGSVGSLEELLDANRRAPGHRAGTTLPAEDRAALIAYVQTL